MSVLMRQNRNQLSPTGIFDFPIDSLISGFLENPFQMNPHGLDLIKNRKSDFVNFEDLEDSYKISIAAPGLSKKDFNISLEGSRLNISYEAGKEEGRTFFKQAFSKSWTLPKGIQPEDVSATYKAGILTAKVKKPENEIITANVIEVR